MRILLLTPTHARVYYTYKSGFIRFCRDPLEISSLSRPAVLGSVRRRKFVLEVLLSAVESVTVFVMAFMIRWSVCYDSVHLDDYFVSVSVDLTGRVDTIAGARGSPAISAELIVAPDINYHEEPVRKSNCGEAAV